MGPAAGHLYRKLRISCTTVSAVAAAEWRQFIGARTNGSSMSVLPCYRQLCRRRWRA